MFERGVGLDLFPAYRIDDPVGHLDDMEGIEGDVRPGQVGLDTADKALRHVDAQVGQVLGAATMGFEVIGKACHDLGFTPLGGKQQASDMQVMEQADVVLTTFTGGFIESDGGHLAVILPRPCLRYVVPQDTPDPIIADAQQFSDPRHRHRLAQQDDQCLHQLGETGLRSRPRRFHLPGLAALAATHARQLGMQIGGILEEVQVPPLAFQGVMHGLCFRSAGRTGEAATALEGYVEMDAVVSRFEAHIDDFPRRLQAQCGSEQGGLVHEASPVGSRAGWPA